ncbi:MULTISPECIES: hypothetical protein [Streptomyces]|uniref:Uncharacterized protein n=2 Tax=Streptomyces rimosus subsp. rimosus TaxID=132474 RepID=L8EY52_STRR1|nr:MULTISPECIES: hypothetical protein [Streptomyces]KOG70540.1 hypothetical protein ADK78_28545 [Kitasatospora aureofaciens]MYT47320.1 hypothetical protein [Streptomyces sp. SID5471]KEF04650.1 hypothetical protein DF17_22445 [Streptomyces rimosus]KEF19931.1 hypothetical protein DF18_13925 [Streptomyces rimosus]KOT31366.1 hypothetical protein ADK84_30060 [Streptomyces sp. NRRL WC-3701]
MTTAELYGLPDVADYMAAESIDAYRAQLVTRYHASTDPFEQMRLYAEAARYDRRHPDESPLADELYGTDLGEVA